MKKTLLSILAAMVVFCGCNNKRAEMSTLTLNLENADGRTVFLCWTANDGSAMVDSTVIADGTATLAIPHSDSLTLYTIKYDKDAECGVFSFFTENQNTTITGDADNMPHWTIEGCQTMNELSDHHQKSIELYENRILEIYAEMAASDPEKVLEMQPELQTLTKELLNYQVEFIRSHSDSYIGHYMLDLMKEELEPELLAELASGLTNESAYSRSVQEYVAKGTRTE